MGFAGRAGHGGRTARVPWLLSSAFCLALVAAQVVALPAQAQQPANSREQEQLRRLRQQLQQLQQEQATAQQQAQQQLQKASAERSALAEQLKAAQSAAGPLRAGAAARARELAAAQTELAALKTERATLQAELGRQKETGAETAARLERSSAELNATRARVAAGDSALAALRRERTVVGEQLDTCSANNVELLRVGQELLGRYGNFGLGETVAAREPFLQFKRVQLENLAQDYRSRIDDQRFTPALPAAAVPR